MRDFPITTTIIIVGVIVLFIGMFYLNILEKKHVSFIENRYDKEVYIEDAAKNDAILGEFKYNVYFNKNHHLSDKVATYIFKGSKFIGKIDAKE
jgi:hypothetical protein